MIRRIDLTNKKFSRLTVIGFSHLDRFLASHWKCKCECGNIKSIRGGSLTRGTTLSCGCYNKETKRNLVKARNDAKRLLPGECNFNIILNNYKRKCLKNKIKFELTKEESKYLMQSNCHYCDCIPSQVQRNKNTNGPFVYNGIDRKESATGYTVENCVTCCGECNWMKGSMPYDKFVLKMKQIANNFNDK